MAKYKTVDEAVKDIKSTGRVKIVGKLSGHGTPFGIYTVRTDTIAPNGGTGVNFQVIITGCTGTLYCYNLSDLESVVETKEIIQNRILELEVEIKEHKSKLLFMEETGSATYDAHEFKVYKALQTLKGKKSDIEKAKIIAQLIKG